MKKIRSLRFFGDYYSGNNFLADSIFLGESMGEWICVLDSLLYYNIKLFSASKDGMIRY